MNDLKDIWQKGEIDVKIPNLPKKWKHNRIDLAHRILKSLRFEYYSCVIFGLVCAPVLVYLGYYFLAVASLALVVPGLLYYQPFIKKIEALNYQSDVRTYVEELHRLTKGFFKHYVGYIIFLVAFTPAAVIFYLWLKGQDIFQFIFFGAVSIYMISSGITMYIGYRVKYGRHFKKIKEMLKTLED